MKTFLSVTVCFVLVAQVATAVPLLQLYVEGGEYDSVTETWVVEMQDDPIRVWVIGNTSSPQGPIFDVMLALAYDSPEDGIAPAFSISGAKTDGYGGFIDPSQAADPTYIQTVTDGSTPILHDGSLLPSHGVYGEGTDWQEFSLGDLDLIDSPLADFIDSFPAPGDIGAQINVYEIDIAGDIEWVHLDAYNHTASRTRVFVPFSHDSEVIPEAGTALALLTLGLGGFIGRSKLLRR